ncbi:MAG TPA: hypothetical protein VJX67_03895, partial [Blastocatellia bacterium]|nr:hypothetical protein [Blastocatellia bacterium]
ISGKPATISGKHPKSGRFHTGINGRFALESVAVLLRNQWPVCPGICIFDIYTLIEHCGVELNREENVALVRSIFAAKRVPWNLLDRIEGYRERHRPGFEAVRDTVRGISDLKGYDFYFDYVVRKARALHTLWVE